MIFFWSNHLLFCRPDFYFWTLVVIQEQRKFHCQFQICEFKKKKEAKRRKSPHTKFTFSIFISWKSKTFDWRSTHTIRTSLCNIHISTSFNYHWISTSLICQILCWILEKHAHTKKPLKTMANGESAVVSGPRATMGWRLHFLRSRQGEISHIPNSPLAPRPLKPQSSTSGEFHDSPSERTKMEN